MSSVLLVLVVLQIGGFGHAGLILGRMWWEARGIRRRHELVERLRRKIMVTHNEPGGGGGPLAHGHMV